MKDLITTMASILIFTLLLTQYIANIRTFSYMMDTEYNLRKISLESEKYGSSGDIRESLDENLKWEEKGCSVEKIDEQDGYISYGIKVEIPDASPGGDFEYKTKCLIKKEREKGNEESYYHDGTCTDADFTERLSD